MKKPWFLEGFVYVVVGALPQLSRMRVPSPGKAVSHRAARAAPPAW